MSDTKLEDAVAKRVQAWLARQKCSLVRVYEQGSDVQLVEIDVKDAESAAHDIAETCAAVNDRGRFLLFAHARNAGRKLLETPVGRFGFKFEPPSEPAAPSSVSDERTFIKDLLGKFTDLVGSQSQMLKGFMDSWGAMVENVNKRLQLSEKRALEATEVAYDATAAAKEAALGTQKEERRDRMWNKLEPLVDTAIENAIKEHAPGLLKGEAKDSSEASGANGSGKN